MLITAERRFGESLRRRIIRGSYAEDGSLGAHPHKGGGVLDLAVAGDTIDATERLVEAVRRAGFAAWLRDRQSSRHVHAVAIGDLEMSAAARWQVKSYFAGRDGRTQMSEDPHRSLSDALPPAWVGRYRGLYR